MTYGKQAGVLWLAAVTCAVTVRAHHSPAAYDLQPAAIVALEGIVTRVHWANPHVYIYLDSSQGGLGGRVWQIEVDTPSNMERHGWYRDSLAVGDTVAAEVFPGRDPADLIAKMYRARKPDGTTLSYIDNENLDVAAPRGVRADGIAGIWAPDPLPAEATATRLQEQLIVASYGLEADVPLTAAGLSAVRNFSDAESPTVNCVPRTAPSTTMYSSGLHSIEVRADVVILRENWFGTERTVNLNVDSHADGRYSVQGHSIGYFDGDTLIVTTERFAPHREGLFNKLPSSRSKQLVERFRPIDGGRGLSYSWEVNDPNYLTEAVAGESRWTYRPDLDFSTVECSLESARQFLDE